jgi:hypothetical protein
MKLGLLFISSFFFVACYSQNTVIYSISPNWDNNAFEVVKAQKIKSESVYLYKKRKNYKDSILTMTQYFDSLGNLIERDEYDFHGEVYRITNYIYRGTVLKEQESTSKGLLFTNGSNLSRRLKKYDQDSLGNVIVEKEFYSLGDSLKNPSITMWNKEYDSLGHLTKEFITLPTGKGYLYHTYVYINGAQTETRTYEIDESWMYSYLYQYDENLRTKSVYLYNTSKNLKHEFFYDEQKRLVMEKDYEQGYLYLDHITQTYFYMPNGLLESQTYQSIKGENYYYKHFYFKY